MELATKAAWLWRARCTAQQCFVGGLGFKKRISRVDSCKCQGKELGLYFVGGSVSSTEFNSRSVLSDLNLESSAWWQFVDGFEGNKIGIGRVFHRQTEAGFGDWMAWKWSLVVLGVKENSWIFILSDSVPVSEFEEQRKRCVWINKRWNLVVLDFSWRTR